MSQHVVYWWMYFGKYGHLIKRIICRILINRILDTSGTCYSWPGAWRILRFFGWWDVTRAKEKRVMLLSQFFTVLICLSILYILCTSTCAQSPLIAFTLKNIRLIISCKDIDVQVHIYIPPVLRIIKNLILWIKYLICVCHDCLYQIRWSPDPLFWCGRLMCIDRESPSTQKQPLAQLQQFWILQVGATPWKIWVADIMVEAVVLVDAVVGCWESEFGLGLVSVLLVFGCFERSW